MCAIVCNRKNEPYAGIKIAIQSEKNTKNKTMNSTTQILKTIAVTAIGGLIAMYLYDAIQKSKAKKESVTLTKVA